MNRPFSGMLSKSADAGDVATMLATMRRFDRGAPRRLVVIGTLAFLVGVSEAGVLGLITSAAVSVTEASEAQRLGPFTVSRGLSLGLAALLLLINLLGGMALARLSSGLAADSGMAAREELLRVFHLASYERKSADRVAALQERLTTYVDRFMSSFGSLVLLLSAAMSLASFATTALVINPLAVLALGSVGVLILTVQKPMSALTKGSARALASQRAAYAEGVTESVLLAREFAVFGTDGVAGGRLIELDADVGKHFARTRYLNSMTTRLYQFFAFALVIGGLALVEGVAAAEITGIATVALILLRSLTYGQSLVGNLQLLAVSRPYIDELTELIDDYRDSSRYVGHQPMSELGTVELRGVGFSYGNDAVLSGIDFVISPGETIGIVGPSGSGKTTLVNLLLRLYEPTEGHILVNGVTLADVEDRYWHRATALVPQEPRTLQGTIAENIRFLRDIDDESLMTATYKANIAGFVDSLPLGLESPIGELGQGFSGGQRQRICIARALAGEPELLVLDEPTSALDGESEAAIQTTLQELAGSVTMVIVAHRLSTLSICDRIVVVDGGRVTAIGSPSEVRLNSAYYREALTHAGM